jgi:hypothetical protein
MYATTKKRAHVRVSGERDAQISLDLELGMQPHWLKDRAERGATRSGSCVTEGRRGAGKREGRKRLRQKKSLMTRPENLGDARGRHLASRFQGVIKYSYDNIQGESELIVKSSR